MKTTENKTSEPDWLLSWRAKELEGSEELPESLTYASGIRSTFVYTPAFDGGEPAYSVVSIEKELELYTLKEAHETLGINDLLKGLLESPLLPAPQTKLEAIARAKMSGGLVCYAQPKIDDAGNLLEQKLKLETTLGLRSASDILVVIAKTGARLTLEHVWKGDLESSLLARNVLVVCEEGAEVTFHDFVDEVVGALSITKLALVGEGAKVVWQEEVTADIIYSSRTKSLIAGEAGISDVTHVLLPKGDAQYDIAAEMDARAANASTSIIAVGAAGDSSHLVYQGLTKVGELADGATSAEDAKFLLLSDAARIDAIPALDMHTGSASAFHKMKVTHITEEERYYASTRGLGEQSSRLLAVESFFKDVLKYIGAGSSFLIRVRALVK